MAGYVIWGRVQQVAVRQYVAIATAVSADTDQVANGVEAIPQVTNSREDAERSLRNAVLALGQRVRAKGHSVIDVETDGV
jgi:hypothetical protein